MSDAVLMDSGPLVAYLDKAEQFHDWTQARFQELSAPFLVPEAVLSEVCFLLADVPGGVAKVSDYLRRRLLVLTPVGAAAQPRIFSMMAKYESVPMSYADACLLWLAETQPRSRVFTLDSDFSIYRLDRSRAVPVIAPF